MREKGRLTVLLTIDLRNQKELRKEFLPGLKNHNLPPPKKKKTTAYPTKRGKKMLMDHARRFFFLFHSSSFQPHVQSPSSIAPALSSYGKHSPFHSPHASSGRMPISLIVRNVLMWID